MFDFPDNPVLHEEAIGADGIIYVWDGVKWISGAAPMVYLPLAGGTMLGPLIAFRAPQLTMEVATMGWTQAQIAAIDASNIDLNPGVSTWTTVQNAISGLYSAVELAARGLTYVGSYNAATDVATFIAAVGIAAGPLPLATATGLHAGDYLIVTSNSDTPAANANSAELRIGDQLISDGTQWDRLAIGHMEATVTAYIVPLSPAVSTWTTVQDAIEDIHTDLDGLMTNAVLTTGTYSDPTWLTSLAWSKITGHPTFVDTAGSYSNPSWLTTLDWSKITNVPAMPAAVTVSDTAPLTPSDGQLWFDAVSTQLFVWYVDSQPHGQWVVTVNESGLLRDAPSDGKLYGRMGGAWVEVT